MAGAIMIFARKSARSMIPAFPGVPSPAPAFVPGIMTGSGRAAFRCRLGGTAGHLDGRRAETISRFPRGARLCAAFRRSSHLPETPWLDPRTRAPVEELDVLLLYGKLLDLPGFYRQGPRSPGVFDTL